MRFLIEYKDYKKKEEKNRNLSLLSTFLNEHCIAVYYGKTYECIILKFLNNASTAKKLSEKRYYQIYAQVEIQSEFENNSDLKIEDFRYAFSQVFDAVMRVNNIVVENNEFRCAELLQRLSEAEHYLPKTPIELEMYENKQNDIDNANDIKRIDCLLRTYKENPTPLNSNIHRIRVFSKLPNQMKLFPYSYIYSEIFSNLLMWEGVKLPGYKEIYVTIAETIDEAKRDFALNTWHKYTYTTLDIEKYINSNDVERSKMVFKSICEGLRMIIDFDHLDGAAVERVIERIDKEDTGIQLVYSKKENEKYLAQILYHVPNSHLKKAEFILKLTDKTNGRSGSVKIDDLDTLWSPYSLGKIIIKKEQVIIEGRNSTRAEISREINELPDKYVFMFDDIIK